jgi:formiminoglutamase
MNPSFNYHPFSNQQISTLTNVREGEIKIGQTIQTNPFSEQVKFVILGIQESVGPFANLGLKGAENAFDSFLYRFLNMQNNRFLQGDIIALAGHISVNKLPDNTDSARSQTEELDEIVAKTIKPWMDAGKIPIVIGGGHNNAYPLIKSAFQSSNNQLSVINLDPHADCRPLEGRHSGNPFSYAHQNGYMDQYTVLGLHKAYNSEFLLKYLDGNNFAYTFFEDYIGNERQFIEDVTNYTVLYFNSKAVGIELDMDSIAFMPSSAFTPSGITLEQARFYLRLAALIPNIKYLHLPEAAPNDHNEQKVTGKALSYLVWEFIHSKIKNS